MGVRALDVEAEILKYEEFEALRLADYQGMRQEEAAQQMNVSRPTFTRIYDSSLKKIARAFVEGKSILIEGGDVVFDRQWYRCNECHFVFPASQEDKLECSKCNSTNVEHINESVDLWRRKGGRGHRGRRNMIDGDL